MDGLFLSKTSSVDKHASSELQYALLPSIAFLNYDILAKIAGFIAGEISPELRKRNGSFRQLYHFAIVCKAFVDPALDELWRSMDSIVPLLKILPELQHKDNRYFILTGNIQREGLERVQIYSQRIRIFTMNERSVPVIPQLAISILLPFLPKVQRVYSLFSNPFVRTWSPIVLSERLQYFRLEGYFFSNTPDVKSILHTLQFTAPMLEHLHLVDPLMDEALNVIPTFMRLRSLSVHGIIEHHQFRQLVILPDLQQLDVNLHVSRPFPSLPLEEQIMASKLQILHLTGLPLTIASVLAAMCGPLKDILVTFQYEAEDLDSSLERSLAVLIDKWSSTLQSFTLGIIAYSRIIHFLSPSHLDSLSKLTRLEVLHISGFALDTPRCKILARSIQSIKELEFEIFDSHTINSNDQSQSLHFLSFIAESCPRITMLQVKSTYDVHLDTIPKSMLSNISLVTLAFETFDRYVHDTGLEKVTAIASYIDLLFPRLEMITTSSQTKAPIIFWRQVFQKVKLSQYTRKNMTKPGLPFVMCRMATREQGKGDGTIDFQTEDTGDASLKP